MTSPINTNASSTIQLREQIDYSSAGVFSKVLIKDKNCQYTLFCLAANTEISKHTSTYNATINVIEGEGILNLQGQEITLQPGIFVFMPAHAPHALKATENLIFLLTLSEKIVQGN